MFSYMYKLCILWLFIAIATIIQNHHRHTIRPINTSEGQNGQSWLALLPILNPSTLSSTFCNVSFLRLRTETSDMNLPTQITHCWISFDQPLSQDNLSQRPIAKGQNHASTPPFLYVVAPDQEAKKSEVFRVGSKANRKWPRSLLR